MSVIGVGPRKAISIDLFSRVIPNPEKRRSLNGGEKEKHKKTLAKNINIHIYNKLSQQRDLVSFHLYCNSGVTIFVPS